MPTPIYTPGIQSTTRYRVDLEIDDTIGSDQIVERKGVSKVERLPDNTLLNCIATNGVAGFTFRVFFAKRTKRKRFKYPSSAAVKERDRPARDSKGMGRQPRPIAAVSATTKSADST